MGAEQTPLDTPRAVFLSAPYNHQKAEALSCLVIRLMDCLETELHTTLFLFWERMLFGQRIERETQ